MYIKLAMKDWHFRIFIGVIVCLLVTGLFASCGRQKNSEGQESFTELSDRYRNNVHSEFQSKAGHYNADTRYMIIVDYSIPSNHDRLFLWDNESDGIVEKFWCAHGYGGGSTPERPVFSNEIGSNCSSLGWFLVERSVGVSTHYGYKYHAVDGLDTSNSNARRRQILIHPWPSVSNDEASKITEPMQLDGRCAGCFTISENGFETLDRYIKSRHKRILLLAIDGID